jgi:hypothetical protein
MDEIKDSKRSARRLRPGFAPALGTLAIASALLGAWPTSGVALNRCEGRDGHVTYTNEPCPPNTRLTRRIDTTPPVVTLDPRGAKPTETAPTRDEGRTGPARETREARAEPRASASQAQAESAAVAKEALPARPAAPPESPRVDSGGRIQPAAPARPANPEQEIQRLDELRLRQERQCADLKRRIQFTRADLTTAGGADRASIELQLRRLEEDARATCP